MNCIKTMQSMNTLIKDNHRKKELSLQKQKEKFNLLLNFCKTCSYFPKIWLRYKLHGLQRTLALMWKWWTLTILRTTHNSKLSFETRNPTWRDTTRRDIIPGFPVSSQRQLNESCIFFVIIGTIVIGFNMSFDRSIPTVQRWRSKIL